MAATEPVVGPTRVPAPTAGPRLARHTITLDDGHRVGLAVCGEGVPLVVVHGFSAEGFLYAQTLSRLVAMGFKVVAIDVAGHGTTQGLPTGGESFESYARLLGRIMDELGIRKAVLAGHSMGGRLVTQLAAIEPERAIAVLLLDAIVGEEWDRLVQVLRFWPPALAGFVPLLVLDTLTTWPLFRDQSQALKLGRLVAPTLAGHARRPWRLLGPAVSIVRSRGSRWMLERIAQERIPLVAVHGAFDVVVPLATSRSTARRAQGQLVVIERAGHSWLLKDPETLPAILGELLGGPVGRAVRRAKGCYAPGARIHALTPPVDEDELTVVHPPPRYRWRIERPR
jgi:pimeloyl-ACP methyl ester carboxylesterase